MARFGTTLYFTRWISASNIGFCIICSCEQELPPLTSTYDGKYSLIYLSLNGCIKTKTFSWHVRKTLYASDIFFTILSKRLYLIGLLHGCSSGLLVAFLLLFFLCFFCIIIILLILFCFFCQKCGLELVIQLPIYLFSCLKCG